MSEDELLRTAGLSHIDRTLTAAPLRSNPEASLAMILALLFGLTAAESRMLTRLVKYDFTTRHELHVALSRDGNPVSTVKTVDVILWQLRRKLKPHGIAISNIFKQGYRLAEDSRDKIRSLLAAYGEDVIAAATPPARKAKRMVA